MQNTGKLKQEKENNLRCPYLDRITGNSFLCPVCLHTHEIREAAFFSYSVSFPEHLSHPGLCTDMTLWALFSELALFLELFLPSLNLTIRHQDLPWWLSAKECRRHEFNPWSRKLPQATEPKRHNHGASALEPDAATPEVHAPQSLHSAARGATTMRSPQRNEDPTRPKMKMNKGSRSASLTVILSHWLKHPRSPSRNQCFHPFCFFQFSSVTQSCPNLRPHGLQHARPPCPAPTPGACSSSCPLSQWCHSTISSSVIPFSSFLQSFAASKESLLRIRWPKYWSFSFSVSPFSEYSGWFPLGLTGLISLQSKGPSRVFSITTARKHQFFGTQPSLWSNSHICTWLLEKS